MKPEFSCHHACLVTIRFSVCINVIIPFRSVWFVGHVIGLALLLIIPSRKNSEKQVETPVVKVKKNGTPPTETFMGNLGNGHGHVRQR